MTIAANVSELVGKTPLVKLNKIAKDIPAEVVARSRPSTLRPRSRIALR